MLIRIKHPPAGTLHGKAFAMQWSWKYRDKDAMRYAAWEASEATVYGSTQLQVRQYSYDIDTIVKPVATSDDIVQLARL
jgi:hypothetical protein